MTASRHEGSIHVRDTLSAGTLVPSAACVGNYHVKTGAAERIVAEKLEQQYSVTVELAEQNTAVAAIQKLVHIAKAAGEIVSVQASVVTPADDASRTVSVDLHLGNDDPTSFATVLSATADFSNSSTALAIVSGTVSSASYAAGDILKLVATVAGGTGNQAKGLLVTVILREQPET